MLKLNVIKVQKLTKKNTGSGKYTYGGGGPRMHKFVLVQQQEDGAGDKDKYEKYKIRE